MEEGGVMELEQENSAKLVKTFHTGGIEKLSAHPVHGSALFCPRRSRTCSWFLNCSSPQLRCVEDVVWEHKLLIYHSSRILLDAMRGECVPDSPLFSGNNS